jgi:YVTN family beta-propeller protein
MFSMCRLHRFWRGSLALALVAGLACDGGVTDPTDTDGWIRVRLTGTDGFTNPFGVRFDNAAPVDVPIGAAMTSDGLRPGSHLVELPERYITCAPQGDRLRQVDVVAGDTIEVRFEIGCFVGRAYVSNNLEGVVSIVDSDSPESVGETFTIGGALRCIAGLRSRRKAWVVSLLSNRIQVLNTSTDQSLGTVAVPRPRCIASHEGSGTVVASTLNDQVVFIDPETDQIVDQIAVISSPYGIAIDEDGRFAYVTHTTVPGRVSVIDMEQRDVVRVLEVGTNPFGIAYDSNRDRLIISNTGSTTLLSVDPADGTVLQSAPVQVAPIGIALSAAGDRIYVVNSASNTVSVLDQDLVNVRTIDVGDDPREVAITSDGRFLVTTNYGSDDLSLVDPALGREVRRIPVGDGPNGILLHGGW